jgi:hypothetical protein
MVCKSCGKEFINDWRKDLETKRNTDCLFCSRSCSNKRNHSKETKKKIQNTLLNNEVNIKKRIEKENKKKEIVKPEQYSQEWKEKRLEDFYTGKVKFEKWNIEKIIKKDDYCFAIVRNHPLSTKNGYVYAHRAIMENKLERLLNKDEIVHHINTNKKDNRIENLEVMTRSEHSKLHGEQSKTFIYDIKCPNCGKVFSIDKRKCFIGKKQGNYTACSRKCSGMFSNKIKKIGIDSEEIQNILSNMIIREYYA